MKKLYTPQEIADLLKVDLRTVYRWLREGKLQGHKVGGVWRIDKAVIDDMFKQNK